MVKLTLLVITALSGLAFAAPAQPLAERAVVPTKTISPRQNLAAAFESALASAAAAFQAEASAVAKALSTEGALLAGDFEKDLAQGAAIFEEIAQQATTAFEQGEQLVYQDIQQGIASFTSAFNAFASALSSGAGAVQSLILSLEGEFARFESAGTSLFEAFEKAISGFPTASTLESDFTNLINELSSLGLPKLPGLPTLSGLLPLPTL